MKKKHKSKRDKMSFEQRMIHLPSPMHLAACQVGGKVHKSKKDYNRKDKSWKKEEW